MISALIGLVLGPFVLYRSRNDRIHKVLGYVWISAMATLALSAFWIEAFWSPYHVGPLHGFAIITLWSLWQGARAAMVKDFRRHQSIFQSLYSSGLILTGALAFLPGRTINRMVFGDQTELGWIVIAGLLAWRLSRLIGPRIRLRQAT